MKEKEIFSYLKVSLFLKVNNLIPLKFRIVKSLVKVYIYYTPEIDPLNQEPTPQEYLPDSLAYFHLDHLGTPIEMTDRTGKTVWEATYQAWGEVEMVSGSLKQPFRFQGQYFDEESGLHYNRFRYYDPSSGRFVSQDPIGLLGGGNLYAYVLNPLIFLDPFGLSPRKKDNTNSNNQTGIVCSLSNQRLPNAQLLTVIKPGTREWNQAIESMKRGGNTNYRVDNLEDAKLLLNQARGNMNKMPRYTSNYLKGFEIHPSEATTRGAPHNNLEHIKWRDFSNQAKSKGACGKGHIFFNGRNSIVPLRDGE